MKALLFAIAIFATTMIFLSCDSLPFGKEQIPDAPAQSLAPPPPVPTAPVQQIPSTVAPVQTVATVPTMPAVPLPLYQWTETPVLETIPLTPLGGMANGRQFNTAAVVFEPGTDKWVMKIHDKPLDTPTSLVQGGQSVNMDLPSKPALGEKMNHDMKYGDGYFQIGNDPNNPESTTSWNADNAWVLEITKWDVKDWDPNGDLFQEAGKASGKIAICYKGSDTGIQNSWLAGTFEDATVRYMGKPYWKESGSKSSSSTSTSKSGSTSKIPEITTPAPKEEEEPKKETAQPETGTKKETDGNTTTIDPEKAKKVLNRGLKSLKALQEGKQN